MNSISKYIFLQALAVMLFVTVVLSFVIWLTQSLRFVDMVVNRGLPVTEFLWLAMLILPRFLAIILPIGCFVAVIYVYNKMTADRELIVLRAAGFSNPRLARPALVLAMLTTVAVYALNAYFLPVSFRAFTDLRQAIRSDYSSVLLQEGAFHTLPGRVTVFIRQRVGTGQLNGILVHDGRNPDQPVTVMAESGALVQTDEGPRVVLVNGNRQQLDRGTGKLTFLQFDKYTIDLGVTGRVAANTRNRNPEELFLWELFDPAGQEGKARAEYIAEGHSRLAGPFLAISFVVVGLTILLSGDFSRRGQTRRIMAAVLAMAGVQTLAIAMHNIAGNNPDMIPLLYVSTLLPGLAGLFVLARDGGAGPAVRGAAPTIEPR